MHFHAKISRYIMERQYSHFLSFHSACSTSSYFLFYGIHLEKLEIFSLIAYFLMYYYYMTILGYYNILVKNRY